MRSLRLSHEQMTAIISHVREVVPYEGCGLLAGMGDIVMVVIPIENVASDPVHQYVMEANALLKAHKLIDDANLSLLGIYHSHVTTDAIPSADDIRDATLNTPNQVHVIVSLKGQDAKLQAWHIHNQQVDPVELLIGRQQSRRVGGITQLETFAVFLAIIIGVAILLFVSFSLLPPAPPIPLPQ